MLEVVVCWWVKWSEVKVPQSCLSLWPHGLYPARLLCPWVGKRSREYGGWGKTSQPNSFNLWSIGCATWIRMLWWRRIGPFLLTNASCRHCNFWLYIIDLLTVLVRCYSFAGIQKARVDQTGNRPANNDHDLFLVQGWLWEVVWSIFSVQPLS